VLGAGSDEHVHAARVHVATKFVVFGDRVVQRGEWGGEGIASGIRATSSITGMFTIRDGQISRIELFFDHDRALKAVGLEE